MYVSLHQLKRDLIGIRIEDRIARGNIREQLGSPRSLAVRPLPLSQGRLKFAASDWRLDRGGILPACACAQRAPLFWCSGRAFSLPRFARYINHDLR